MQKKTTSPSPGGSLAALLLLLGAAVAGCTVVNYTGPAGERFSRSSLGASTAIATLQVEAGSNGLRSVRLEGYRNESEQALSAVTEAAVRAALRNP